MRFLLVFPAFMLLALLVRFVGWILWVKDWIAGESSSITLISAMPIGLSQGWAIVSPIFTSGGLVIGACALACAVLLSVPLLGARLLRRRPPAVFISYHNSRGSLAAQLSQLLADRGIEVRFLPFDPAATHDELLMRVDKALAESQYVVCLPGGQGSFVDAEVLAAAATHKPIVFVVDYPDGHLPNTGAKKYPVLMTRELEEREFDPLADLLLYLHGGWRKTWELYSLPNAPVASVKKCTDIATGIVVACLLLLFMVLWFGGLTLYALEYFYSIAFKVMAMTVLFVGMALLFGMAMFLGVLEVLLNGVSGLIHRQRVVAAARDAIRTGNCSDAALRTAFAPASDKGLVKVAFLDVLWPVRPLAHHESSA